MVVVVVETGLCHVVAQLAVGQRLLGQAGVHTGLVQRQRVKARKHADIRQDGGVVLGVAVAVGRNVLHQRYMEAGPPVHHRLGVLGHAAVQLLDRGPVGKLDGVKVAGADAAAAAHAGIGVDVHLAGGLVKDQAVVGALPLAAAAAAALVLVDQGDAVAVLLLFAGAAAAAHAQVLDGAAEARLLVPFEVVQADDDVRVHNGAADAGFLDVLAALHRHRDVVGAFQAVADQDGAAHRHGGKAVLPGAVQVLQRIFAAAGVKGVAVGQKRLAAQLLDHVGHRFGVVGAQKAQVAQLAEMHLDGDKLALHVDLFNAGLFHQPLELGGQALAQPGAEIGKVDLRFFHLVVLPVWRCAPSPGGPGHGLRRVGA